MVSSYRTPLKQISVSLSSSNLVKRADCQPQPEDGSTVAEFRFLAIQQTSSLCWSVLATQQLFLLQRPSVLLWENTCA